MSKTKSYQYYSCKIPRRAEAIEALYCLVWMKNKKDIPNWVLEELKR